MNVKMGDRLDIPNMFGVLYEADPKYISALYCNYLPIFKKRKKTDK